MRLHRIAVLTALAFAACGGGTATRAEFVENAEQVCAEHNEAFDELNAEVGTEGLDEKEFVAWLERYVDEHEEMTADLKDLDRPEDDAAIEQYFDRLERNDRGFRDALDEGTATTDAFFSKANNSDIEARNLAEKAGLHSCSPRG